MAKPVLVVIHGAPGSGKTTLCRRLEPLLPMPLMRKDDVKELLFDHFEQSDLTNSALLGKASFEMLYALADTYLSQGKSVAIEGAFFSDYSPRSIDAILKRTDAAYLEIYCCTSEPVRQQRYKNRAVDGSRHPGHHGRGHDAPALDQYKTLGLGDCIDIDTTNSISDTACGRIITAIQNLTDRG